MDWGELKKKIQKMVLSPDEAPTIAQEVVSDIDAAILEYNDANVKIGELEQKNKDLQNTNIKLYLAQTSDKPEEEKGEEEKSIEELEQEFINMVIDKEDKS